MVKSLKITQVLCKESQMVCSLKKKSVLAFRKRRICYVNYGIGALNQVRALSPRINESSFCQRQGTEQKWKRFDQSSPFYLSYLFLVCRLCFWAYLYPTYTLARECARNKMINSCLRYNETYLKKLFYENFKNVSYSRSFKAIF